LTERDVAAGFLIVKVGDGGAILDVAHTVDRAAGEEQCLSQGSLPCASVSKQDDVTQLLGMIFFHRIVTSPL
jgi:hypothetical protein